MRPVIRREQEGDRDAVFRLNAAAFPTEAEAKLVDTLRSSVADHLSLVALHGDEIVGHIMFTPIELESNDELRLMGLAPMAVAPHLQRGGIGTDLVRAGLRHCRDEEIGAVAVLGHPEFYPRFGFRPASIWQIRSEYDAPDEVFMLLELEPGYLANRHGVIRYHPSFAGA